MKTTESNNPAPSGAPRGGYHGPGQALGAPEGVSIPMKTPEPPLVGSMDYYREMAKTNPDIAVLVGMIDRQGMQLVKALDALAGEHAKRIAAAKILTTEPA